MKHDTKYAILFFAELLGVTAFTLFIICLPALIQFFGNM